MNNNYNNINSLLNQHQISSIQQMHNIQMSSSSQFDPNSSHEDFIEQMLSSVPNAAASSPFPWSDDHTPPPSLTAALQQQILLSRGIANGNGFIGDHNDGGSSNSINAAHDASIKALFNGSFAGALGQTSNQPHQFQHPQGGALESQNFSAPAGAAASGGGGSAAQPRQRVRARRGQATDPHSIAERLRRERIAERMKGLQELVPNANKTDKASMLDEIIDYVKFLQLQVKVLSMSRLGGAAAAATPLVADENKSLNGTHTASSSTNPDGGATVTEQQVAKLLEEDMGSAMQYLQGKGLCLMPISLATAISTATCHTRANSGNLNNGVETGGPTSPSMSGLTVQSATTLPKK